MNSEDKEKRNELFKEAHSSFLEALSNSIEYTDSNITTIFNLAYLHEARYEFAEAEKLYKEAVSVLDKGTIKGLIKKNTASRKKSMITRHLNSLQAAKTETK